MLFGFVGVAILVFTLAKIADTDRVNRETKKEPKNFGTNSTWLSKRGLRLIYNNLPT